MSKKYKKSTKVALFATAYLFIYATLLFSKASVHLLFGLLLLAPAIVIYLVYVVISEKDSSVRPLKEDEEFSYQDWEGASEEKEK